MSTAAESIVTGEPLAEELEQVFREHYRWIYRTAHRMTGTSEDAEDVLQTIFLRLLRREFPPDLKRSPKAYLYRAAVNLSLDIIRSRQRRALTADAERIAVTRSESDEGAEEEMDARLRDAIAELNPGAAQILMLRYVHNYSDAAIAKLLGTSRGTIAVSLFRSRSRLKKLLGEKP